MTTIATRDELLATPEGQTIRVLDRRNGVKLFTRSTGDTFLETGTGSRLTADIFDAALMASVVEHGPVWTSGAVLRVGGEYEWYVLDVTTNDQGREQASVLKIYAKFYPEGISDVADFPDQAEVIAVLDDRQQALLQTGRSLRNMISEQSQRAVVDARRAESLAGIQREAARVTAITDSIHSAMSRFDDEDDVEQMRRVLREHDLSMPSREVEFTITVTGVSERNIDAENISGLDNVSVGEVTATVSWTREIVVTETYEGDHSDPCEDREVINDDWVRAHLDSEEFDYDEHSIEIESRNCDSC